MVKDCAFSWHCELVFWDSRFLSGICWFDSSVEFNASLRLQLWEFWELWAWKKRKVVWKREDFERWILIQKEGCVVGGGFFAWWVAFVASLLLLRIARIAQESGYRIRHRRTCGVRGWIRREGRKWIEWRIDTMEMMGGQCWLISMRMGRFGYTLSILRGRGRRWSMLLLNIRGWVVFQKLRKGSRLQQGGLHGWLQWLERQLGDGRHGVRILFRSWIKYVPFLICLWSYIILCIVGNWECLWCFADDHLKKKLFCCINQSNHKI